MILNFSELRVYFEHRLRGVVYGTFRAAINLVKKLHIKLRRTWAGPQLSLFCKLVLNSLTRGRPTRVCVVGGRFVLSGHNQKCDQASGCCSVGHLLILCESACIFNAFFQSAMWLQHQHPRPLPTRFTVVPMDTTSLWGPVAGTASGRST